MTSIVRRIALFIVWVVIGTFGGLVLAIGLPNALHAKSLTVMSGSMEPTIGVGDVVVARMQDAGADCVLVTVDDELVGIFTDRDAVVKAAGTRLDAFPVRDFMTADPVVLRHDDPIALAIHKMAVGGFRHIPIVEHGRPTGVVTARDVFHHLAEGFG